MPDLKNNLKTICVYCGSADGLREEYYQAAYQMGSLLAQENITLVYGAGKTGLMGSVANGALEAGGSVIGVVPDNLNESQLIHSQLTQLEVVSDIQLRKARMSQLADAFIALPGGFGTFDELFETLTWAQIGLHSKPIGLLNTLEYFNPLISLVDHALAENFIYDEHRVLLVSENDPKCLLNCLQTYKTPSNLHRWITR